MWSLVSILSALALSAIGARAADEPLPPAWVQHAVGAVSAESSALSAAERAHAGPVRILVRGLPEDSSAYRIQLGIARVGAPRWLATAEVGADGIARFAAAPEGVVTVLLVGPVGPVPDQERYGVLYEAFVGELFPFVTLRETSAADGAREAELVLVAGTRATGSVATPSGEAPVRDTTLAWVASPGRMQLAPVAADGGFLWSDPRPAPEGPFDPAAPSAAYLERLVAGVHAPSPGVAPVWNVPAPWFGGHWVIELAPATTTSAVTDSGPLPLAPPAPDTHAAARRARWQRFRAAALTAPLAPAPEAERRTLAAGLLERAQGPLAAATAARLDPADDALLRAEPLLAALAEWLALEAASEPDPLAERRLLAEATPLLAAALERAALRADGADAPRGVLQAWIDATAERYPAHARAVAERSEGLRAPSRRLAPSALPTHVAALADEPVWTALRRRPSSAIGPDLAPHLAEASSEQAARLVAVFNELAADPARGPLVRDGVVDLLLALDRRARRGATDSAALAEALCATFGSDPLDERREPNLLAALAPFAPEAAAQWALELLSMPRAGELDAALPAVLALARLRPNALAERCRALGDPELLALAAAALVADGPGGLDGRRGAGALCVRVLQQRLAARGGPR